MVVVEAGWLLDGKEVDGCWELAAADSSKPHKR